MSFPGDGDRVGAVPVDHGTQQGLRPGPAHGDESAEAPCRERRLERPLGRSRVLEFVDQDGGALADSEGPQAPAHLVRLEAAAERLGEDVAREPPLGLPDHPLAHQLQGDGHRGVPCDKPLELGQRRAVADDGEPRDR